MDSVGSHAKWDADEKFGYPLLADPDGILSQAFGVHRGVGPFLQRAARVTFVIGPGGMVAKIFDGVTPRGHADEVWQGLEALGFV